MNLAGGLSTEGAQEMQKGRCVERGAARAEARLIFWRAYAALERRSSTVAYGPVPEFCAGVGFDGLQGARFLHSGHIRGWV